MFKVLSPGIMEKIMETTIVYWGYIGIMEKNMETTMFSYEKSARIFELSSPVYSKLASLKTAQVLQHLCALISRLSSHDWCSRARLNVSKQS